MSLPNRSVILLLFGLLAIAGCRDSGPGSAPFELRGRLVVFNYRVARANFLISLGPLRPVEEELTAVTAFENPAGGAPIMVRQKIWPLADKTTIESPPLACIVKDRAYAVTIRIEAADGTVRQTIETTMISSQDQDVLPDKPLVVGPLYTPNPDVAGHPDGQVPGVVGPPCPANG